LVVTDFDEVMRTGAQLDLHDCAYGEWRGDFVSSPHRYYYFLAGLVRTRGFTRILEIGTHYGGATTALSRGIVDERASEACIVTLDITHFNDDKLRAIEGLQRITGDSLRGHVIDEVCRRFSGPIDLLYVDSRHERLETLQNIAVYANRLQPVVIVLDDIHLNQSMQALWRQLVSLEIGRTTDVSKLVDRKSAGFGVIECVRPYAWPELRGPRRAAWLTFREARKVIGPYVPSRGKRLLRDATARYRKH
jgi:hypothetical protein